MNRISRLGRLAAAAVLVASGATFAFAAPTGAEVNSLVVPATGSIVDNGDGTVNVSYSGEVVLFLQAAGSVCAADLSAPPQFVYVSDSGSPPGPAPLPASPYVLSASTSMYRSGSGGIQGNVEPVTAGNYQACMFDILASSQLASVAVSIGQAAPTTTTTTTTAPGTDPVAPAFTG